MPPLLPTHPVHKSSSRPHAAPRQAEEEIFSLLCWTQAPCLNFRASLSSTSNLTTPPHTSYPLFVGTKIQNVRLRPLACSEP